jgi:hypothetical protein
MPKSTITMNMFGGNCRWAAITSNAETCNGSGDWTLSGSGPTRHVCAPHMLSRHSGSLPEIDVRVATIPGSLRRQAAVLSRLAEALEAQA